MATNHYESEDLLDFCGPWCGLCDTAHDPCEIDDDGMDMGYLIMSRDEEEEDTDGDIEESA